MLALYKNPFKKIETALGGVKTINDAFDGSAKADKSISEVQKGFDIGSQILDLTHGVYLQNLD